MTHLKAADKALLNDFSKSQPALNRVGEPAELAGMALGDHLASALASSCVKAVYDFALHGGAISPDITLNAVIPAGALITGAFAEWIIAPTSGGAATLDLKVGTNPTPIVGVLSPLGKTSGDIQLLTVIPTKVSADSAVILDIDTAALTAGKIAFYVQYVLP